MKSASPYARAEPIPFFGELGSVNPMFILSGALGARGESIAQGWAGSLTMGAGQFCTNPGIAIAAGGADADLFAAAAKKALSEVGPRTMLTDGIASAFRKGRDRIESAIGVNEVFSAACEGRSAAPSLFITTGKEWLARCRFGGS